MQLKSICKILFIFVVLCGFGFATIESKAAESKEFKGSITTSFFNEGAKIEIHWYVDKEKNMDITSFTDSVNESVIIIEGKHTKDFPVIRANYDKSQILVTCQKATIILDNANKIVSVENNDGFMEFDDESVKTDNKKVTTNN